VATAEGPWYARKPPWWLVALIVLVAAAILIAVRGPNVSRGAGSPEQARPTPPPVQVLPLQDVGPGISADELLIAPTWRVVLHGDDSTRMQRFSMSEGQATAAGLTAEEAGFEGHWDYFGRGITIKADRTFTYWVRGGVREAPPRPVISSGAWSVSSGRLRLEHREIRDMQQPTPRITEHTLEELERSPLDAQGSMEGLKELHRQLLEATKSK
jgi:hypothetical protein